MQRLTRFSQWVFIGILAYVPLHIFLSTWIGTSFGVLPLMKVAKDIVVVIGALTALAAYASIHKGAAVRKLLSDRLILLILAYTALTLLLALTKPTDSDAEVLGVVFNLRFFVFFVYGILLTGLVDVRRLRRQALVAVFASGLITLVFGVFQYLALPNNALTHVGYSRANGVLPAFFIDDKPDLERIMSTQRDPNSFGSYVLILLALALILWVVKPRLRRFAGGTMGLSVLCLWFTFSRSAWIGACITIAVALVLTHSERLKRVMSYRNVWLAFGVALLAIAAVGYVARDTYIVQNVIFHADQSTTLEDPNQLRVRFYRESVENIAAHPLGTGPGTSGLASIRNNVQGTRLNENYYLQIATEVGIIGLMLFVAILVLVAMQLYSVHMQGDWLAAALLASFAGLAFTNLLVHIWATEAVAYTWWGLAGLLISPALMPRRHKVSKAT